MRHYNKNHQVDNNLHKMAYLKYLYRHHLNNVMTSFQYPFHVDYNFLFFFFVFLSMKKELWRETNE